MEKSTRWQVLFFLLDKTRSDHLARIGRLYLSPWEFYVSFCKTDSSLYICHLSAWPNFGLLHNFKWIPFLTQSFLLFYSFCASLLHSLIMWLTVSDLSPHNPHLLFCVLPLLALTQFLWHYHYHYSILSFTFGFLQLFTRSIYYWHSCSLRCYIFSISISRSLDLLIIFFV